jgi:hypothetical protein
MPNYPEQSAGARYRRLAGECLETAHTFPVGERRTVLLQMAQVWQRLADEQRHVPNPVTEQIRPVVQQQQQVQPKDDEKKE